MENMLFFSFIFERPFSSPLIKQIMEFPQKTFPQFSCFIFVYIYS